MTNTINIKFRKDLQGLRAIAIILVVLAHLDIALFKGGFIGVDVFFVLSGYLITGLLLKEYQKTQSIDFFRFYARRLKRLLPSLLLMLVVTMFTASFLISPYELISKTKSAIYASTWTSNLYFSFSDIGYFSEMELQDLFLHTWSLAVEEQFYLFWPIFLFTCLYILKKNIKVISPQAALFRIFMLVCIASFLLSLYWSYTQSIWAFYLMPTRIWQFAIGGIVFVLFEWKNQDIAASNVQYIFEHIPTQLIGLLLIIISGILLASEEIYPGWWAFIPSIGAALVLVNAQYSANKILTNPVLTWIGDRSYAWYLWHWPIILIANAFKFGHTIIEATLLAAISLFIASISFKIIEVPFWKGQFSKISAGKCILASICVMTISAILILQILNSELSKLEQNTPDFLASSPQDAPIIYSYGCDSWYANADINPCSFSADTYNRTVVLLGDSILAQWFSLVTSTFSAPEWRVVVLTKSSCPMVDEDYFYERLGKVYEICNQWRNNIFDTLLELKPEVIITGSSTTYPFTEKQWIEGSKRIFSKLSDISRDVIVISGTPKLGFDGPSCLMKVKSIISQETCSSTEIPSHVNEHKAYISTAASTFENVNLLDLNEMVCPERQCSAITSEGIVVYRDHSHLTDTFVRSLAPQAKTLIESIGIKLNHQAQ